jgi:methylenetetrahydrofolate dehydrogenase (NADP+) / methenyltetrahydrofolate cyclohydrolase
LTPQNCFASRPKAFSFEILILGKTMTATQIDGKALAQQRQETSQSRAEALTARLGRKPGLGVILVGEDPASSVYVRNKEKAAERVGLYSERITLPADATHEEVLKAIREANQNPKLDAFLVQLPLPKHLNEDALLLEIDPKKDADGLHPNNLGLLLAGLPAPRPCTPSGIIELLKAAHTPLEGAHAVVIGRSNIVGKPIALMLLEENCTVTLCHSRTKNLDEEVRRADIVIAALGRPQFVQGSWLKPGCTVIDVGINRVEDKLVGDIDFEAASKVARAITPVPGGVGPMTVTMLLENTLKAAEAR